MTFCIGMKVKDGLVGIADTRVTSGVESTVARKIAVIEREHHVGRWWQDRLVKLIQELPSEWVQEAGKKLRSGIPRSTNAL